MTSFSEVLGFKGSELRVQFFFVQAVYDSGVRGTSQKYLWIPRLDVTAVASAKHVNSS